MPKDTLWESKMSNQHEVIAELRQLSKNFGITIALNKVDMEIRRGEIRGLIGENGSGKSTAMSILSGLYPQSSGEMFYKGNLWNPSSALDATRAGIGIIVQEIGTIPTITVAENIFLGDYDRFRRFGIINKKQMFEEAQRVLDKLNIEDIQASAVTNSYSIEQRKLIEIAKVVAREPEIFIVDETSTAISETGRNVLYNLMHDLAANNKAVIFISHDLNELMEHCDALTILRDGCIIDNIEKAGYEADDIKEKMIGRKFTGSYYRSDMDGYSDEVVLKADCITTMEDLMCFDLELHKGEILGIGGLSGCGMHTLGKALFGLLEVIDGEVILTGPEKVIKDPTTAFSLGMGYISKSRDTESLEMNASIGANIQSTGYEKNRLWGPFISAKREKIYAKEMVDTLAVKCTSILQPVKALSGGNKQKVVFGKWIGVGSEVLILDCPTRGVDIGVKAAMYQLIYDLKKQGKSMILISEELPELCGMSDRLIIMKDGKISGEFFRKDGFDNSKLIACMI